MLSDAESNGVKILNAPIVSGSRYFMTSKEVRTPADFAGMKVRTPTSSNHEAGDKVGCDGNFVLPDDIYILCKDHAKCK